MIQRIFMIVLILVVVLGGGYYAYQQLVPPPEQEATGPVYSTQPVTRGDIYVGVDVTGPLNPSRGGGLQVDYSRGAMGASSYIIDALLVQAGDPVYQGEVVAILASPDLETRIKSLEEQIRANRQSLADLMDVPVDQVDRIDPAKGITLRAPIDGRVVGLTAKEGTKIEQGVTVARIVDDSRFRVIAKFTPGEISQVKVGDRAVLRFPQMEGLVKVEVTDVNTNPIPEDVSQLTSEFSSYGSSESEQYEFVYWVTLEGENTGLLRPGMQARVGILRSADVDETNDTALAMDAFWTRYYASIEGFVQEERVYNKADAIATRVYVKEMQTVKAGDPLVSLAGKEAQQDIEAKLDKIRQQEMELSDLISQQNKLEIRAPMDGIVANIEKQAGQTVGPGEWFGYIYNTSDMRLWGQVDDVDVLLVQQGAPVQVTVDALPGRTFEGSVEMVDTMGYDQNGITRFGVNIKVVGSVELRPGMQGKAHVKAGSATGVLLVPLEAIFEEDGQSKVEILLPDGTTKVVAVELGLMNDRVAEVKSGLEEGQLVITGSTADLLPSQRIQSKDALLPGTPGGDKDQNGSSNNTGNSGAGAPGSK
ncbi:RND transporter [Clostridiales bacterium PH28_bin88]|nr:RND transporter [Clostridiales bacterium PH28_bin88]